MQFLVGAFFTFSALNLNASTYYSIPQKVTIDQHELQLNGTGIKTSTWLNIKVYYAALYLRKRSSNVKEVLAQKGPKRLVLKFLRNISKDHLVEGWQDAFKQSLSKVTQKKLKPLFDEFSTDLVDVTKKDNVIFTFYDDSVSVEIPKKVKKTYKGSLFSESFFSLWFVNPVDPRLKEELLN